MNRNGLQLPIVRFCGRATALQRSRRVALQDFLRTDVVCELTDCRRLLSRRCLTRRIGARSDAAPADSCLTTFLLFPPGLPLQCCSLPLIGIKKKGKGTLLQPPPGERRGRAFIAELFPSSEFDNETLLLLRGPITKVPLFLYLGRPA